jgi:vitamin B12 transporter
MMSTKICARVFYQSGTVWVFSVLGLIFFFPSVTPAAVSLDEESGSSQAAEPTSQEEMPAVYQLDPMVVSATKTPVPLSHLTSAVEVITAEDLQRRNVKTVAQALRLSQSLAVFSNGGAGTLTNVRIRGGTSEQTLVFIDGTIMNSGTSGSFNFANLTTDNIEKIEILRGAQGMLWGSDAIGGVINITTKRGKGTPKVRGFFEYGSFNSIREGASVAGDHGPVDFSFSLSRWDNQGFSAINYRRGAVERDAYRNWTGSTQLGVSLPKEGRLSFNFRWMNSDVDFDNSFGPSDVFKAKSTNQEFVYSGVYYQPITDWWTQQLTVSRMDSELDTQAGTFQKNLVTKIVTPVSNFNNSEITTQNNRVEWQNNFQVLDPLLLTVGYQFRQQQGENESDSGFSKQTLETHSGFAQLQLNLFDRFFATAGFRQDSTNTAGDATTYRVTGAYLLKETDTKIRSSYATGFRAPSINELFFPNFGNPDLKPEKSQSLDVGIDQKFFGDRAKLSVGYFWNRYRELILSPFDPVGCAGLSSFGFCAQNIGSAKSQGWEVNGNLVLAEEARFIKLLDVSGQYTYTITRDLETAARLPLSPVHQGSVVLTYKPIEPLTVTTTFRYVGSRFNTTGNQQALPDFHVINLAASYDFTSSMQGYVRVENLLDRDYEERLFFGTPVRSVWGGIRVNFDVPGGTGNS